MLARLCCACSSVPALTNESVLSFFFTGTFEIPVDIGNGLTINTPRHEDDVRRLREWRVQHQAHRELQELSPADGATVSGDPISFQVPGVGGWTGVELHLMVGSADETPVVVGASQIDIVGDVLEAEIGGFYQGTTVFWEVVGDAGQTTGVKSFTFEAPEGSMTRSSGGVDGSGTPVNVAEASYEGGGMVQNAVGRIYFSATNPADGKVYDYACSGTAVFDNKTGRSTVLTAAHCVWDDIWEQWGGKFVLLILLGMMLLWKHFLTRPSFCN